LIALQITFPKNNLFAQFIKLINEIFNKKEIIKNFKLKLKLKKPAKIEIKQSISIEI
jgi:hypothetical protein